MRATSWSNYPGANDGGAWAKAEATIIPARITSAAATFLGFRIFHLLQTHRRRSGQDRYRIGNRLMRPGCSARTGLRVADGARRANGPKWISLAGSSLEATH